MVNTSPLVVNTGSLTVNTNIWGQMLLLSTKV